MSKENTAPPTFREAFNELIASLNDGCSAAEKLTTEKNVDTLNDLRYDFYSSLLEVSDAIKEMLKGFRKKHKMTEKDVRARMAEEEAEDGEEAEDAEPADNQDEAEEAA